MSPRPALARLFIRVKYKPCRYHQGGEMLVLKRKRRNLGREFRAYVSDDIGSLWQYTEHRLLFGEIVL